MAVTPAQTVDLAVIQDAVTPIQQYWNSTNIHGAHFGTREQNFHLESCLYSIGRAKEEAQRWLAGRHISKVTKLIDMCKFFEGQ